MPASLHLRPTLPTDIPTLHRFQLDPESNALAATFPRDYPSFLARWTEVLADPTIIPRVIIAAPQPGAGSGDPTLVGSINIVRQDGLDSLGYWIAREHWGKGIATRAIALMLQEVTTRPLHARAAAHNTASIRALQRHGFVITGKQHVPASERFRAGDRVTFILT